MQEFVHQRLPCGIEAAVEPLPGRHTVVVDFRFLTGAAYEPEEHLGVARLVEQTLSKGTQAHDGRALLDALDEIGLRRASWSGREVIGFRFTCLAEYLPRAIELYAEMFRRPTFPSDACQAAVAVALAEIRGLEDDPGELIRKLMTRQAYGAQLGRHPLGEPETLQELQREHVEQFWREQLGTRRMQVAAAGPLDAQAFLHQLDAAFAGFGEIIPPADAESLVAFAPSRRHHQKELEQEHIAIAWPGVPADHPKYPTEAVLIGLLSGVGMSSRLFTEVREKQGLAYWVAAWHEHPRKAAMIHLAAATTPDRADQTYATLLREVQRLSEDLTDEELDRTKGSIIARTETQGDITRAHAAEIADDLFHYGRPVPIEEKLDMVRAVTVADIHQYLEDHPRDRLCVLTLGPRALAETTKESAS
jgi:predicted Zn-dependent peptidase